MNTHTLIDWHHPTGKIPRDVILLGLGETKRQYADVLSVHHDPFFSPGAEVWTLNAGFRIWPHDLLWVMDDLEGESHKWPVYGAQLRKHKEPIITSTAYDYWPTAVAYPFEAICEALRLEDRDRYFFNSIPYILAYALAIGVRRISMLGIDYTHPASPGRGEDNRANAEWWCGFLRARGVSLTIANDSTLMNMRSVNQPLYGYKHDPRLSMDRRKMLNAMEEQAKPKPAADAEHAADDAG